MEYYFTFTRVFIFVFFASKVDKEKKLNILLFFLGRRQHLATPRIAYFLKILFLKDLCQSVISG
jgi:hypothetical protein